MSPERIAPKLFGFENTLPTIPSDCYAFGMVIYETITRNFPFHKDRDLAVYKKVITGKRPPRGVKFTTSLWGMLERCWAPKPTDRPNIEDILRCLEMVSNLSEPPSPGVDDEMEEEEGEEDESDSTADSSGILTWTSGTVTAEGSAATPPRSSHPVDRPTGTTSDESIHDISLGLLVQKVSGGKSRCIWSDASGNECGFKSSSSLVKRHVRTVHLKIRYVDLHPCSSEPYQSAHSPSPVVCTECGASFANKFRLKTHQNTQCTHFLSDNPCTDNGLQQHRPKTLLMS